MKAIDGYFVIKPDDHSWKLAEPMKIPFADLLERTGSEILGARIWRFPPKSAGTWHKHVKAEEFYFVLDGVGRMRVGEETLTVPKYGGVLAGPSMMRQVFNDTDAEVLWLMIGAPDKEFGPAESFDIKRFWPTDPKQLPKEMAGVKWPPQGETGSAAGDEQGPRGTSGVWPMSEFGIEGGVRMNQETINDGEWKNPDNWTGPKWLSFYFSKRDSRVWVPKQIPSLGWTVNLGRPGGVAWLVTILVGLPLIVIGVCVLASSGH